MKKRKLREYVNGTPLEWPKEMDIQMLNQIDRLSGDLVISVVCELESHNNLQKTLSIARKNSHQKEFFWAPINGLKFILKASVRFIQCLLNANPVKMIQIA